MSAYPDSARSYGLSRIPIGITLYSTHDGALALSRNAAFSGLFNQLKNGRIGEAEYRAWCDRFWLAGSESEVTSLVNEYNAQVRKGAAK